MKLDQRTQNISAAVIAVVMVLAIAVASGLGPFGHGHPFADTLTTAQQHQLERVHVAGIHMNDGTVDRATRVAAHATACEQLDPSVPAFVAYRATCAPYEQIAQLTELIPERCDEEMAAPCVRLFKRLGRQFDALATTGTAFHQELSRLTTDPSCLEEVGVVETDAVAFRSAGLASTQMAGALESRDTAALQSASMALDAALKGGGTSEDGSDLTGDAEVNYFHEVCGLEASEAPVAPAPGAPA